MKLKLDHIYGEQPSATVDLTPVNNKITELENKSNQIDNRVTSLSNISAKTNVENTFTTNQVINGTLKSNGLYTEEENQRIAKVKRQTAKYMTFDFEQNNRGFRNYCGLRMRFKYSQDADYTNLFWVESRAENFGMVLGVEGNKIVLQNNITLEGVATPTADSHAANKEYVDRTKAKIKEFAAASNNFDEFKRRIATW